MKISDTIPEEILQNPAYQNILTRVSIRNYTDAPVSDRQLTAILHAAMAAPSGVNKQPWEYIVITDRELLQQLSEALPYAKMAAHAPLAILVCGNTERFLPDIDNTLWEQDCSAASENILLAAHAIGHGGVWTCIYPHPERIEPVRQILNLPPTLIPFNLIPIGHPETNRQPIHKWHPDRIHFNRFTTE